MELRAMRRTIRRGAGLVHAEVTVEADSKKDQVEPFADGTVVVGTVSRKVGRVRIQDPKRTRPEVDEIHQLALQREGGSSRIGARQATEFIQREHRGAGERGEAGLNAASHLGIDVSG